MWYMVSPVSVDRSILERQDKDGDETAGACPLHNYVVSTRMLVSENLPGFHSCRSQLELHNTVSYGGVMIINMQSII